MATTTSADSKASSRLFDIASLENDGSNFSTWRYRVKTVLEIRGLLPIVDGTEPRPVPTTQDPKSTEIANWDSRDREAKAQITLTIKDEPLNGVMHATSSKEAWDKLNERYQGTGKQTIAYLIAELFRGTLDDQSPLGPQMDSIIQKGHIINTLGVSLDDQLIAIAIVISLPPSYETLKTILTSSDDKLTTEKVTAQVLRQEKDRKHGSEIALLARHGQFKKGKGGNAGGKGKDSKDEKKKVKCGFCGKKGHGEEECRKKQATIEKLKQDKPKELTAKVARTEDEEPEELELFVATETRSQLTVQRWILDSGASGSMSSQREFFHSLIPLSTPKRVRLGDDSFILATHRGRVVLNFETTTGGSYQTVLPGVFYVPDLAGNLLSISNITGLGYKISFEDSGCVITHKKFSIRGSAKQSGGLYVINCRPSLPS